MRPRGSLSGSRAGHVLRLSSTCMMECRHVSSECSRKAAKGGMRHVAPSTTTDVETKVVSRGTQRTVRPWTALDSVAFHEEKPDNSNLGHDVGGPAHDPPLPQNPNRSWPRVWRRTKYRIKWTVSCRRHRRLLAHPSVCGMSVERQKMHVTLVRRRVHQRPLEVEEDPHDGLGLSHTHPSMDPARRWTPPAEKGSECAARRGSFNTRIYCCCYSHLHM